MTPQAYKNLFEGFKDRDARLHAITRYELYHPMFYRSELVIHGHRVSWVIQELTGVATKVFGDKFDATKAKLMGLVHDDSEIIMGDIQAGIKNKMSAAQLAEVDKLEEAAIEKITKEFPSHIGDYSYRQLLQESFDHSSIESQVMQFADKFDALGEALHEVYAGNISFMTPIENEYGLIDLPVYGYLKYFENFATNFPQMKQFVEIIDFGLKSPQPDFDSIVKSSRPHTIDSITEPTGYRPYDKWLEINLKYAWPEQRKLLVTQVER